LYVKNMGKDIHSQGNAFVHIYFSVEGDVLTFCRSSEMRKSFLTLRVLKQRKM